MLVYVSNNGEEAEQQLRKLSLNNLISNSKYLTGEENLRIRFVDIEDESMDIKVNEFVSNVVFHRYCV